MNRVAGNLAARFGSSSDEIKWKLVHADGEQHGRRAPGW
jgi:hypothetical protein